MAPRLAASASQRSPRLASLCGLCCLCDPHRVYCTVQAIFGIKYLQRFTKCPCDQARKPATRTGTPAAVSAGMSSLTTAEGLNRLTSNVLDAAIRIHRALGPGLLENAYLTCLEYELMEAEIRFERQRAVPLVYKGVTMNCGYRADLVVEGSVLIEVKALEVLAPIHIQQLQTYLRLGDYRVGLLLNFGAATMKAGIKRIVNRFPDETARTEQGAQSNAQTQRSRAPQGGHG